MKSISEFIKARLLGKITGDDAVRDVDGQLYVKVDSVEFDIRDGRIKSVKFMCKDRCVNETGLNIVLVDGLHLQFSGPPLLFPIDIY